MSGLIKVGVLDEHEVVRRGLRAYLAEHPAITVTGVHAHVASAFQAIEQGQIDVLLMDQCLECESAVNVVKALKNEHPQLRILVLLAQPQPSVAALLLAAGAHGVVCKRQPLAVCVEAIELLASGKSYICSSVAVTEDPVESLASARPAESECALISSDLLSLREREVLRLCISGLSVTRIAQLFDRSLKTVSTQKLSAYRKLGLTGDMDLFKRLSQYKR